MSISYHQILPEDLQHGSYDLDRPMTQASLRGVLQSPWGIFFFKYLISMTDILYLVGLPGFVSDITTATIVIQL